MSFNFSVYPHSNLLYPCLPGDQGSGPSPLEQSSAEIDLTKEIEASQGTALKAFPHPSIPRSISLTSDPVPSFDPNPFYSYFLNPPSSLLLSAQNDARAIAGETTDKIREAAARAVSKTFIPPTIPCCPGSNVDFFSPLDPHSVTPPLLAQSSSMMTNPYYPASISSYPYGLSSENPTLTGPVSSFQAEEEIASTAQSFLRYLQREMSCDDLLANQEVMIKMISSALSAQIQLEREISARDVSSLVQRPSLNTLAPAFARYSQAEMSSPYPSNSATADSTLFRGDRRAQAGAPSSSKQGELEQRAMKVRVPASLFFGRNPSKSLAQKNPFQGKGRFEEAVSQLAPEKRDQINLLRVKMCVRNSRHFPAVMNVIFSRFSSKPPIPWTDAIKDSEYKSPALPQKRFTDWKVNGGSFFEEMNAIFGKRPELNNLLCYLKTAPKISEFQSHFFMSKSLSLPPQFTKLITPIDWNLIEEYIPLSRTLYSKKDCFTIILYKFKHELIWDSIEYILGEGSRNACRSARERYVDWNKKGVFKMIRDSFKDQISPDLQDSLDAVIRGIKASSSSFLSGGL